MAVLNDSEVQSELDSLEGWKRDGKTIVCDLELTDFDAAIELVNAIAALAQERDHHPDILVHGWNRLALTLSTHSEGGITVKDLELARAIDALPKR